MVPSPSNVLSHMKKLIRQALAGALCLSVVPIALARGASGVMCHGLPATIVGTEGDDRLTGTASSDVIVGLGGKDEIHGRGGHDRICAGAGGDYENDEGLYDLDWEIVFAGPGDDLVAGGSGPDQLYGGAGDDRLYLGDGGLDNTVSVDNDGIGGPGDDLIFGTAGSDHFVPGHGNDVTFGRRGYDYFVAGRGKDQLVGGLGRDYVYYDYIEGPVIADFAGGRVDKGNENDSVRSISDASGTEYDDTMVGTAGANTFYAGGGDDTVRGAGGRDCLAGGNGNNELVGGPGFDLYAVSSLDCLTLPRNGSNVGIAPTGSINVDLADGVAWRVGEESRLTGIEGAFGTYHPDRLFGDATGNELYGGPGRDEVHGRDGDDYLDGGEEIDTLDGGLGTDKCVNGEAVAMCE